ncbi:hypothetical protein [Haloplanus aerogenes]|uniref:Uncharacterized protein n=1 Tax=Haloplanus aerogenes TaxID=660522 RepID=A0A3M0DS63_9EURY|nr:hypothetical protein [Haloplanus aerogenes]AZH25268.1 hypothetical protein DU502_07690 [Haloplanus aerogenes]RMB24959.1 hypothetical protein ATH50_0039 [Haloplanus aerogenes]
MSDAESADESTIQTGAAERADRAADVTEVNWHDVWAIAKAAPGEPLSPTQASLCVQVSDQCPPETDEPAREYLGRAVEKGQLKPVSSVGGADLFVTGESA